MNERSVVSYPFMRIRNRTFMVIAVCLVCILVCLWSKTFFTDGCTTCGPHCTPWQSIGGCGAGGSGGGSTGIKWIGEGVPGGILEVEMLPKLNFGRTFMTLVSVPRLTYTPLYTVELGVSMPIGMKIGQVQHQTNMEPGTFINNGRGDLTLDIMQKFGSIGQYSWQLALSFPTGQWDAARGTDASKSILPQTLQMGRGVYSATLGLFYSFDVEDGMFVFDGFFDYPYMFRIDKKNKFLATDYQAYQNVTENRERFYYRHMLKPYGESDRGDYYPPSVSFDAMYAYRGVPLLTQSFQLFFSAPLGVRWIRSYIPTVYKPIPDPDHRSWDVVLSYGIEFADKRFPLFFGIGLPIHDRRDPIGKWDAPDWESFGQEWIFASGFKTAFF